MEVKSDNLRLIPQQSKPEQVAKTFIRVLSMTSGPKDNGTLYQDYVHTAWRRYKRRSALPSDRVLLDFDCTAKATFVKKCEEQTGIALAPTSENTGRFLEYGKYPIRTDVVNSLGKYCMDHLEKANYHNCA